MAALVLVLGTFCSLFGLPASHAVDALDTADPRHVRALYLDVLGRTPLPDEMRLAAASTPDVLVRHLLRDPGFWDHWYEDELYYFLLIDNARPDDEQGEDALCARLAGGRLDVLGAVGEIVSGQAFNRANPGNDTFVSVVLEQLLDMNVQRNKAILEAGKKMYDGRRVSLFGDKGASQADLVRIVMRQDDFAQHIVNRQYQRIVGSPPDRDQAEDWADALRADPGNFPELVRTWITSSGYATRLSSLRPKTDIQFIRGLFVDLTGDPPGATELQRLRGALGVLADAGPLRAVIARTLLDDHLDQVPRRGEVDGKEFVTATFLRYLGRPPGVEEEEDFLLVYAQEETEPATIVRAIVTHGEYQYY